MRCFVGVDVGTGSARAGVFDVSGQLLGESSCELQTRTPQPEHFEQSSQDIWCACCKAVRSALAAAGDVTVAGIAFDATCSLVVQGPEGCHLAVGADLPDEPINDAESTKQPVFDVILWCDHRAAYEAEQINGTGHRLLGNVGGAVSPEMEMPKLAWLKRHRPRSFAAARRFLDLADYLTLRAAGDVTGAGERSICTVVCKWNFDAAARAWDKGFLEAIGLSDLGEERIGTAKDICDVGAKVPRGVGAVAASELGFAPGTMLGTGIIDAHAGGLGCLGVEPGSTLEPWPPLVARMALIAGTSACHMASGATPVFVPGVWGPYDSAMIPGLFLNEGGQSAAGAALGYLIQTHAAYPELSREAMEGKMLPAELLSRRVVEVAAKQSVRHLAQLTLGLHVGPDFNGNRSPLADPKLRGSIVGLGPVGTATQATSVDALAVLYLATVQALAYSTRAIVDEINKARAVAGVEPIRAVIACGGLAQNELYLQTHADVLGLPVTLPHEDGAAVVRGSAILAAAAAGQFPSVADAMRGMSQGGRTMTPCLEPDLQRLHGARFEVFKRMQHHQQEYRAIEADATVVQDRHPSAS